MTKIKRKCPKCGKQISVDTYEYCCPLCGEFFDDMNNTQVIQNHIDLQYDQELETLIETIKRDKKSANVSGVKAWLSGIGTVLLLCLNPIGLLLTIAAPVLFCVILACSIIWGPFVPLVNHFKYKKILEQKKQELKLQHESNSIIK